MKKWKWFSFKRKTHKKKSKTETESVKKIPKKKIKNSLIQIKSFFTKNYSDQIKAIKKLFSIILGYGLIINYSLSRIFPNRFTLSILNLLAFGIAYYFISDEFVEWFRRLIAKR